MAPAFWGLVGRQHGHVSPVSMAAPYCISHQDLSQNPKGWDALGCPLQMGLRPQGSWSLATGRTVSTSARAALPSCVAQMSIQPGAVAGNWPPATAGRPPAGFGLQGFSLFTFFF